MRALCVALLSSSVLLFPCFANADDRPPPIMVSTTETHPSTDPTVETYRGHFLDLSALAGRQDFAVMSEALRHQIDIVEGVVGLSPHVVEFFRTIPVLMDEAACLNATKDKDAKDAEDPKALLHAACYGQAPPESSRVHSHGSVWDSNKSKWVNSDPVALAQDTNLGIVMVRPVMLGGGSNYKERPVMLHELLHAYHNRVMPQGFKNPGLIMHYNLAKKGQLYPADAYLMTNEREFFAVTASVFLYGNDGSMSRSTIKEKQPDYYTYLVFLFGFDPDRSPTPASEASLTLHDSPGAKLVSPNL
jgi:hypothetical protein